MALFERSAPQERYVINKEETRRSRERDEGRTKETKSSKRQSLFSGQIDRGEGGGRLAVFRALVEQ